MASKRRDCTEVKTDSFTYEWEIKNFKYLDCKNGEDLESSIFTVGDDEVKWYLELFPRGEKKEDCKSVSLYLGLDSPGLATSDITVNCEMSILISDAIFIKLKLAGIYRKACDRHGWRTFVKREKLLDAIKSNESFVIQCKIKRPLVVITKRARHEIAYNLTDYQMKQDCSRFMDGPDQFADVTIIIGQERFPAHKFLLAARSRVFAAMFRHNQLKENRTNEVDIEDIDSEVMRGMLEFIYSDEVSNLSELSPRLIAAAHKYELRLLKTMCEKALLEILDPKNAAEILMLVDLYGSQKAVQYVIEFIADHFSEVADTDAYQGIKNPELLRKLVQSIAKQKE